MHIYLPILVITFCMNYLRNIERHKMNRGPPQFHITPALREMPGELSGSVSSKVAEVFMTAGIAFQKLGELTLQLNSAGENEENMKWTEREVETLRESLNKFAGDLDNISQSVQNRTQKHIKMDLKRKAVLGDSDPARSYSPAVKGQHSAKKAAKMRVGNPKAYGAAATPRPEMNASSQPPVNVFLGDDSYTHPEIGPPSF